MEKRGGAGKVSFKRRLWNIGTDTLTGAAALLRAVTGQRPLISSAMKAYSVRGVDVSSHNGEINWETLANQGLSFVFMKATEGSDFVDRCFAYNYAEARKTHLRIGAYVFFSYTSAGKTQAENYIRTVPKTDEMLPPVIDVELLGKWKKNPPEKAPVQRELNDLIAGLTSHYGMAPILYASQDSYRRYLADAYAENDIWFRNVVSYPRLADGREWTFWQYTDKARLAGYTGGTDVIDMNVFSGTAEEFAAYPG